MTSNRSWTNDSEWLVTVGEESLPDFHPYLVGNGRIGVRVGPMVLDWNGDSKPLHSVDGPDYWGRLNPSLLMSVTKHVYDGGAQLILPAWNQLRLEIGNAEYSENTGRHSLRNTLDLRNGEVTFEDVWEYQPGRSVSIAIRLVVPRSSPCAAWFEIKLAGLSEPARLRFGLNAGQVTTNFPATAFSREETTLFGTYTSQHQSRTLVQGLRWEGEGWQEADYETGSDRSWISLSSDGQSVTLTVVQSTHYSSDGIEPQRRVCADLDALNRTGREKTVKASRKLWQDLWASGLNFRHANRRWERLVLLNQFHVLANLEEESAYPLGPLGISRPGWHGSQMWDADFWLFRGILPLWPKLAQSIVRFRLDKLAMAQANARNQGLRGAFFPWKSDEMGNDKTSPGYRNEIHNNAWIGLAAWEVAGSPPDKSVLENISWPILEGVADFFVSRSTRDADGNWHLRGVVPPDESVREGHHTATDTCDDNVLTNVGARTVLRHAMEAARILGHPIPPEWTEVAERLIVLPPDPDGIIPEYAGYSGHTIKQADTILAFYPYEVDIAPDLILKNVDYYHGKTDRGGPLMTTQFEALLTMLHGDREQGLHHLFAEFERYVRGPHQIPYETPANANSIMLTGIGGLFQALIFGWYGASLDNLERIPRIRDDWQ